ncbi:helix-turn-helix transcriptional regulator [Nostoc ellipsosporum NOK]|nr:helix-turn-helix transcriptional regulator [Nostoc ellipsosporum NOK]
MKKKTGEQLSASLMGRSLVHNKPEAEGQGSIDMEMVKAIARLTYGCVYVIDYTKMAFDYVSDSAMILGGRSAGAVREMGYDFYFKHVPEEDLALLAEYNEKGFDFFDRLPEAERLQYSIHYDFHIRNSDGIPMLVHHKLTPLKLTENGKMWKALCVMSFSHHRQAGNAAICKEGSDIIWRFSPESGAWQKFPRPSLSAREIEVLRLYAQGLTINEIAKRVSVSPDTVKYYRRRIFETLDVGSVVEALGKVVG